jgi:hypothetical protein
VCRSNSSGSTNQSSLARLTCSPRILRNPKIIMVPISVDRLKELIQSTLKHGDCAEYVAKLINKAVKIPNDGQIQPIESTNIMNFLRKLEANL